MSWIRGFFTSSTLAIGMALALVIGNAEYKSAPLRNPVNDARAMTTTLRGLGFGTG